METRITTNNGIDYRFAPMRQIKTHMPEKIAEGFIALILQIYSIVGQRISADDAKILASGLADDCTKRYCSLSMADVSKALNDGARGLYGEFVTPSLKLFNQWLAYYRQTYVPVTIDVPRLDESKLLPLISHDELMKQQLKLMNEWYDKHETLDNFYAPPMFEYVYQYLEDAGEFTLNSDQKWELFDTSRKHIFNKMQLKATSRSEQKEAKRLSDIVKGFTTPSTTDEKTINKLVKRECYRICIEKYLNS